VPWGAVSPSPRAYHDRSANLAKRTPIMANKLKPKLLAICQDDWGKRAALAAWADYVASIVEGSATAK
jgi:hypothetical protein